MVSRLLEQRGESQQEPNMFSYCEPCRNRISKGRWSRTTWT